MKCEFNLRLLKMEVLIMGDRECPNCEDISLVEHGLTKWKCLICGQIFDEEDLDSSEE
jgi:ribosomal protein S27AE